MIATHPPPPSRFVTLIAWISLVLGIVSVASGLSQAIMLLFFSPAPMLHRLAIDVGTTLPPTMTWILDHLSVLNLLSTLLSALFAWTAYGLLKRMEWGRLGFIALLVFATIGVFVGVEGLLQSLLWFEEFVSVALDSEIEPAVETHRQLRIVSYMSAVVIAALHGWIIYMLCTPGIRREFHRRH